MPRVSTYLNFPRSTEAAFLFYKSVLGTEISGRIARYVVDRFGTRWMFNCTNKT